MSSRRWTLVVLATVLAPVGCGTNHSEPEPPGLDASDAVPLSVASSAFARNSPIPVTYTCEGSNDSPPLQWGEAPAGTETFAIVVEDPDAPGGTFTHWILYDIPASVHELRAGADAGKLPRGARRGENDWIHDAWDGPCPPKGTHRYVHRVFALDDDLGDLSDPDRHELERAAKGHVIAKGEVVGTYRMLR